MATLSYIEQELSTERWRISSELLAVFWEDVFPRLVARSWEKPASLVGPDGEEVAPPPFFGDATAWLLAYADDLMARGVGTDRFREQLDRLRSYFRGTLEGFDDPIPVFGLPGIGYDFVLSDDGMDLLLPPDPWDGRYDAPEREVYRMYTYRETARRAIKVPGVTGAAGESGIPNLVSTDGLGSRVTMTIPELSEVAAKVQAAADPCERKSCLAKGFEKGSTTPDTHEADLMGYCGLMEDARAWQLSGRAWRALLNQLPRVVAWVWFEQSVAGNTLSYETRWTDPGDEGLRSIFEERLEMDLPPAAHMRFEASDSDEVVLTNQGLFVPPLPAPPSRGDLLTAWQAGTGGMPVFSDSARTE